MSSIKELLVRASAEHVWDILYERFDEIYIWSSDIKTSVPDPDAPKGEGRYCEIAGFRIVKDSIWHANSSKMTFTFIRTGFPFHVKDVKTEWLIRPSGSNRCQITNDVRIHLNRTSRYIFHQPLLNRLDRLRGQMLKDLHYFAEYGRTQESRRK